MNPIQRNFKPRMMLRYLYQSNKLSPERFDHAMRHNCNEQQPLHMASIHIQILGYCLIIAGIICLTAFNWFALNDLTKLAIAEIVLTLAFLAIIFLKNPIQNAMAGAIFGLMIGVFWAVFGQIYQINSSLYHYPLVWGISLLPFAILLRQQFTTALTLFLLYCAFWLYVSSHTSLPYLSFSALMATVSSVITLIIILLKKLKVPSFSSSSAYLFFALFISCLFATAIQLASRDSMFLYWVIFFLALIALIYIFLYLNELVMMVLSYLSMILISFIFVLQLVDSTLLSLTFSLTFYALCLIYPTYLGATLLIKHAKKVHHHAQF